MRIAPRPSDQASVTLDTHHARSAARDRQREIADATEQVQDPVGRRQLEQLQRPFDHPAVDFAVDLGEVARRKAQGQVVGRQLVVQIDLDVQRLDRLRPAGLQVENHVIAALEVVEQLFVGRTQWVEDAQDQHAALVVHRHLDLWQSPADAERANQRAELRQDPSHSWVQDMTGCDICNVTRTTLAKADQHLAFARNILDAESRLAAVPPGGVIDDRWQDILGFHLADLP